MKIITHHSVDDFLASNESLLLKKESFHNLILGLAYGIRDKKVEPTEPLFYSIENGNEIIACAMRSHAERPFIITELNPACIDLLIEELIQKNLNLAAVVGEENTALYFKERWTKIHNLDFKVNLHLGVYECYKVIFPKILTGELIEATDDHQEILSRYIAGFLKDCFPEKPINKEEIENLKIRHLQNKSIYLLRNHKGEIVSMAANTRSTLNGGTISLVYTPPEWRGKGHASTTVALLSDKIIKDGKNFSCLFTDLTNPTSNSIYQKVGFNKIGQNIDFDFIKV